jgi:hypothetical protein
MILISQSLQKEGCNATSIITRIETAQDRIPPMATGKVAMQLPL